MDLQSRLAGYPGRGIVLRNEPAGWRWVYFVTGRSAASRERVLRRMSDQILVAPVQDTTPDELRHYACAVLAGNIVVIGNGDHVGVVASRLTAGMAADSAWRDVLPEPDPPINTPRIALTFDEEGLPVLLSARDGGDEVAREAHRPTASRSTIVLTTYDGDVDSPKGLAWLTAHDTDTSADLFDSVWASLTEAFRVAAISGIGPSFEGVESRSAG